MEVPTDKEEVARLKAEIVRQEMAAINEGNEIDNYSLSDLPLLISSGEYQICFALIKDRATMVKFGLGNNRSKRRNQLLSLKGKLDNINAHIRASEWSDRYIYQDHVKELYSLLQDRDKSN